MGKVDRVYVIDFMPSLIRPACMTLPNIKAILVDGPFLTIVSSLFDRPIVDEYGMHQNIQFGSFLPLADIT